MFGLELHDAAHSLIDAGLEHAKVVTDLRMRGGFAPAIHVIISTTYAMSLQDAAKSASGAGQENDHLSGFFVHRRANETRA